MDVTRRLALVLAATLAAAPAAAQTGGPTGACDLAGMTGATFDSLDANDDGALSFDEYAACSGAAPGQQDRATLEQAFTDADADADLSLSLAEVGSSDETDAAEPTPPTEVAPTAEAPAAPAPAAAAPTATTPAADAPTAPAATADAPAAHTPAATLPAGDAQKSDASGGQSSDATPAAGEVAPPPATEGAASTLPLGSIPPAQPAPAAAAPAPPPPPPPPAEGYRIAVATLKDAKVLNTAGEQVGKVSDVLFDPRGKTPVVIVSVGGILGVGAREVAFPYSDFTMTGEEIVLNSDLSADAIGEMPEYDAGAYQPLPTAMRVP